MKISKTYNSPIDSTNTANALQQTLNILTQNQTQVSADDKGNFYASTQLNPQFIKDKSKINVGNVKTTMTTNLTARILPQANTCIIFINFEGENIDQNELAKIHDIVISNLNSVLQNQFDTQIAFEKLSKVVDTQKIKVQASAKVEKYTKLILAIFILLIVVLFFIFTPMQLIQKFYIGIICSVISALLTIRLLFVIKS